MAQYVYPALGSRPVQSIHAAVINATLAPIWPTIPATASRVKKRVEKVLKWVRAGRPLPAPKASDKKHHAALAFTDLPQFMAELRAHEGITARALEHLILTAARTGEVVGGQWSEIDFEQKLWSISAERMKAAKLHRVPLSDRVVEILKGLPREARDEFLFVGSQKGRPRFPQIPSRPTDAPDAASTSDDQGRQCARRCRRFPHDLRTERATHPPIGHARPE
jgi:integrase